MKINQVNVQAINNSSRDALNKSSEVIGSSGIKESRPVEKIESGRFPDELKEVINEDMLQKSIDQANKALDVYSRKIERSVHEITHTVMYTIRDTDTNEIISEFPPRKIQDMIAKMWELAGLFVDKKA